MSDPAGRIATSSQTVGPFFHFGLATDAGLGRIAAADTPGTHIELRIGVLDGEGAPVPDALIEVYHADADGNYSQGAAGEGERGFSGFGRLPTNADGICTFATIKPGAVRIGEIEQAPHVNVCFLSRGLLRQIYTRIYFEGDPGVSTDPILGLVPAGRRHTLMAHPAPSEPGTWDFVIRLQGDDETVFFDL
jgi:protocatechuate 3,4-dioxygenase, alpha subunit